MYEREETIRESKFLKIEKYLRLPDRICSVAKVSSFAKQRCLTSATTLESFVKGCPIDLEPKTMTAAACHLSALQPVSRTVSHGAKQRRNEVGHEREKKGRTIHQIRRPSAVERRCTTFQRSDVRLPFLKSSPGIRLHRCGYRAPCYVIGPRRA